MTERSVEQRLESHARAIRELRAEVKALKAAAPIRDSDSPAGQQALPIKPSVAKFLGTVGVYVNNSRCLSCGSKKEDGRRTILCGKCNRLRQAAIQHGDDIPRYTCCGNCGKKVNGTSMPLCGKCQVAYRKWRDGK
jgi:hypothetical protein